MKNIFREILPFHELDPVIHLWKVLMITFHGFPLLPEDITKIYSMVVRPMWNNIHVGWEVLMGRRKEQKPPPAYACTLLMWTELYWQKRKKGIISLLLNYASQPMHYYPTLAPKPQLWTFPGGRYGLLGNGKTRKFVEPCVDLWCPYIECNPLVDFQPLVLNY